MRSCAKNKRSFYALNYKGKEAYVDSEGYETGEEVITYSKAFVVRANISGAKGSSAIEVFGTDENFDKIFTLSVSELKKLKIDEHSVFFIDTKPTYDESGYPLYDYRVKRIADTPNEGAIALEKVRR